MPEETAGVAEGGDVREGGALSPKGVADRPAEGRDRSLFRAQEWPTNGHLIATVARFGYIVDPVLDATYGDGVFWQEWKPDALTTSDLHTPAMYAWDFTALPLLDASFSTVVFDPPYKLNGTSRAQDRHVDEPYGVHEKVHWQDKLDLIAAGAKECARVAGMYLLIKCMDQVCSQKMRWQSILAYEAVTENPRWRLVDQFLYLNDPRAQDPNRRVLHAQGNYSTLLVFGTEDAEKYRQKTADARR